MTDPDQFPSEPSRRRALLAVPSSVRHLLHIDPEARDLIRNDEVAVVDVNCAMADLGIVVVGGSLLPRRVYLQSPFRFNQYVDVWEADTSFALERHQIFLRLCQFLGASRVQTLNVEHLKSSRGSTVSVGASVKKVGLSASRSDGLEEGLSRSLKVDRTYVGQPPDFEGARALLAQSNLAGDLHLRELIEAREHPNSLRQFELEHVVTESSRSVTKLAAALKFPAFLKVDGGYQTRLRLEREIRVKLRLEFNHR